MFVIFGSQLSPSSIQRFVEVEAVVEEVSADAFILNPAGHFGLFPEIFLVTFPLVQVMAFFLLATIGFAACLTSLLGAATGVVSSTLTGSGLSCESLTRIVGAE